MADQNLKIGFHAASLGLGVASIASSLIPPLMPAAIALGIASAGSETIALGMEAADYFSKKDAAKSHQLNPAKSSASLFAHPHAKTMTNKSDGLGTGYIPAFPMSTVKI